MVDILENSPVIPVVAIENPQDAVPLAEALLRGGINAIEVTLRTPRALEAIELIKKNCPAMVMGVGTIMKPTDILASEVAGADFLVSPGLPPDLLEAFQRTELLVLPGTATPTEAMRAYDAGFHRVKLFPAEAVGGIPILKSINGPMPQIKFMPTGGVNIGNLTQYLELPNVFSVGGTWIARQNDITGKNWDQIENNAREAMKTAKSLLSA